MKINERQLRKIIRESLDEISNSLANRASTKAGYMGKDMENLAKNLMDTYLDMMYLYREYGTSAPAFDAMGLKDLMQTMMEVYQKVREYSDKKVEQSYNLGRGAAQREWDEWPDDDPDKPAERPEW